MSLATELQDLHDAHIKSNGRRWFRTGLVIGLAWGWITGMFVCRWLVP